MQLPMLAQDLVLLAAAIVAVGTIWQKVVIPVLRKVKQTRQLYSLHEKVDILTDTLTRLEPMITQTHHEVNPNSGLSLKDQVTRIERKLDEHLSDADLHNREG